MPVLKDGKQHSVYNGRVVDKESEDAVFFDDTHEYFYKPTGEKGISVTQLISAYEQPFDSSFWASYKAMEALLDMETWLPLKRTLLARKKFDERIVEKLGVDRTEFENKKAEILQSYEDKKRESCERGTAIHAIYEQALYKKDPSIKKYGFGGHLDVFEGEYSRKLGDGVYPEYMIAYRDDDICLVGQIDLLIIENQQITIIDHKGLPVDTKILTTNGFKTMGELKIGDTVFDKNGEKTKIIEKSKVHYNPCYKITFDNGDEIIADHEHKWFISFRESKKTNWKTKVMTTEELSYFIAHHPRTSVFIPKILNAKPLKTGHVELPVDPYVFGAWLGDGSKSCGVLTQSSNSKIWSEIEKRGYRVGDNLIHDPERSGVDARTIFGLCKGLKQLECLNNKHIPEIYFLASYEQRLDLLRGLMDTDGSYNKIRKRYIMNTSFKWQADGLYTLLCTLGIKPTKFEVINTCNGQEFPGYNVTFTTDINPFLVRNQHIVFDKKTDKHSFRCIKKVEEVETVPTQCISVDSSTHSYLCTEGLIPTHNTNAKLEFKSYYNPTTKSSVKMKPPLQHLDDVSGQHYTVQLSLYAWMVQQIHPEYEVEKLTLHWIDHDNNEKFIDVPYLKDDVEHMIAHYKKQKKIQAELDRDKPFII